MALENDVEDPSKSAVFSKHPAFLKDHHVRDYVCDTLRMAVSGTEPFELDQLLELDMEVHHHSAGVPIGSLSTMADSLPGLGIVAAVLGVVITMGALGGPPEEIGNKVAAALVGTFLGHLALLWPGRADRLGHGKERGRRARLPARAAGGNDLRSSKGPLRSWPSRWRAAPFPGMCAHRSRSWRRSAGAAAAAARPRRRHRRRPHELRPETNRG